MNATERISAAQLSCLLFLGSVLVPFAFSRSILFGISGVNLPLAAILCAAIEALCYFPIAALEKRSEGKGASLRFFYSFYFLFLAVYELSLFLTFLSNVVHSGVSPLLMAAGLAAAAAYGSHKGIECIARAASVTLFLLAAALVFLIVSSFAKREIPMELGPVQPLETGRGALSLFARSAPVAALFFLKQKARGTVRRAFLLGCVLSALLLALTVWAALRALGPYFYTQLFPVYKLAQAVSFGPFAKMELPFLGVFLLGLIAELSLLLYLAQDCVCARLAAKNPRRAAALFFALCLFLLSFAVNRFVSLQHVIFSETLLICVCLFFCLLLPVFAILPKRKIAAALALALMLGLFPGCGGDTIRTRAIVSAIYVTEGERAPLEARMLCTGENGGEIYCEAGGSLSETLDLVRRKSGKTPTLSRELSLLLSPSFAKNGVFPLCDFLTRYYETAPGALIFCCAFPAEETEFARLSEKAAELGRSDAVGNTDALELVGAMLAGGGVFALPLLERDGEDFKAERAACFSEGAWCGTLDPEETRCLLLATGRLDQAAAEIFDPQAGRVTLGLKNVRRKRAEGYDLILSCDADISEAERSFEQILKIDAFERFAQELEKTLAQKIKAAYEKAALFGCAGIFGFESEDAEPNVCVSANVNRMEEEANPVF